MKTVIRIFIVMIFGMALTLNNVYAQSDTLPNGACIVYLESGSKLRIDRLAGIYSTRIEIEKDGSLHDVAVEEVQQIKCGSETFIVRNDSLVPLRVVVNASYKHTPGLTSDSLWSPDPNIDYAALGRSDANAQYSMVPGVVTGFLTTPTLLVPPIMAAIQPSPSQKYNPNSHLYNRVPEYKAAYRKRAHGKKAAGILIGVVSFVALVAALSTM
jgi:hypothetical protein